MNALYTSRTDLDEVKAFEVRMEVMEQRIMATIRYEMAAQTRFIILLMVTGMAGTVGITLTALRLA